MNLISVYTKRPARSWILYCNIPEDGWSFATILRVEARVIGWIDNPILIPQYPEDMVNEYGSRQNPMLDQQHNKYCCLPHRPVEWWKEKAAELSGQFNHEDGLPVIKRQVTLFIDDLLKEDQ